MGGSKAVKARQQPSFSRSHLNLKPNLKTKDQIVSFRELDIGYAKLKRFLDMRLCESADTRQGLLVSVTTCGDENDYDSILATILT